MEATKSAEEIIGALRRAKETGEPLGPELLDLRVVRFTDADLSGLDLTGCDFSGCEMSRCNLTGADCSSANFDGAQLYKATLDDAQFLCTTFRGANLTECKAFRAGFGMTDFKDANFSHAKLEDSTFVEAQIRNVDFRASKLARCRFYEADLVGTDFAQADLRDADLRESNIEGVNFRNASLRGSQLREVQNYTKADWIGADIRDIDFAGAYLVRQHIIDENFLYEYKRQSRITRCVYFAWKWTSDCGRSLTRWGLFLSLNVLLFALIYWGIDQWAAPAEGVSHLKNIDALEGGFIRYLYYSVVTFTTLGYGDVSPTTAIGQGVLIVHITFGYLGLGALLSILATKFASRGH
jgi:uncharacterized protein YjbI with pentapeptide repeats